jgi:parvulin-like peptidyl-prolyl isomerase
LKRESFDMRLNGSLQGFMSRKSVTVLAFLAVSLTAPLLMGRQAVAAEESAGPEAEDAAAKPSTEQSEPAAAATQGEAQPPAKPAAEAGAVSGKVPPQQKEVVMARVGERKITVDDFMKYISQNSVLVPKATTSSGKAEILREMILDRLIEEGMRREGLLPTDHPPTRQDYVRAYNRLAARHFPAANAAPPEEEVHQYYLDHQGQFGIPAMVRIGQIQFRVPAKASAEERDAAKARAEQALKRLRAGESFGELAKTLSENPKGKVAEGDLGFLPLHQDPWLDKAVTGLQVGQFSDVLESPVGYEIILLKEKRDALIAPYANVRDTVIKQMRTEAQRQAREAYAWQLAKEVGVSVEMKDLQSAIP